MKGLGTTARALWALAMAAVATLLLTAQPSSAADRPYLAVTSAAAEEDDDNVWSLQTAARSDRWLRSVGAVAEYAFDPVRSVQLELTRSRSRGGEIALGAELEYKHLFNHIARDGWGWGVNVTLGADRTAGERWRAGSWSAVVPISLSMAEKALLGHLNLGLERERGERRHAVLALGLEGQIARGVVVFGELARRGDERLAHVGVRHWIKRDRLALDVSITSRRVDDAPRTQGWVLGLAWYDL